MTILLPTRFKLGLFDPEADNLYSKISIDVVGCEKHRVLAREAAQKSIVLLKNENDILPLNKDINYLFVVGPTTTSVNVLLGNYYGLNEHMVTMMEGIIGKVNPGGIVQYEQGCLLDRENVNQADWTSDAAAQADITIAFMGISGLLEGEEGESIASPSKGDRLNMDLPQNQIDFLKNMRAKHNKPIIVVITGGSPIDLREVEKIADAILFVWYPGQEGGNGVADVLFGDVSPSGRLPITFPKSLNQLPPYEDYNMPGRTYRYMEKEPMYPFGFGLNYTSFDYSQIELSKAKMNNSGEINATIQVKNSGNVDADEVIQLYISDLEASVQTPLYALKDFKRIHLKSGESKKINFKITPEMLLLVNHDGESILEPGEFKIYIGPASPGKRAVELGISPLQEAILTLVE